MNRHALRAAPLLAALALAPLPGAAQQRVMLPAADRPLAGRPADVFAIGAAEGQSWEMLNNVAQVGFDARDNLYVLDRGGSRVLVFDRAGRFVRQLGKRGGGPGEFEVPIGMAVRPDGSLAVLDLGHSSFSLFRPDGRFLRTSPWRQEWGLAMTGIQAHPAGGAVGVVRPNTRPDQLRSSAAPPAAATQVFSRLQLDAEGGSQPLFEIPDANRMSGSARNAPGGGRQVNFRMMGPPEFAPLTLWGVLPDGGVALAHNTLYTVKIQDARGHTVRFLQRPMPVRLVTERDKDRARAATRERMRTGEGMIMVTRGGGGGMAPPGGASGQSQQAIEQRLREMEFADTMRALQGLTVAPSGKLWIQRTPREVGDNGPIDVVTAAGRYLGTLTGQKLPQSISASGRAAYVERDDEGVERVVVRQLPAGWR